MKINLDLSLIVRILAANFYVMARLTEYNYDICIEICDLVANGKSVIKALESDKNYPTWSTFRRWKQENEELQTLYARSIQDKSEMVMFEIQETMQEMRQGKISAGEARVIIDTLKWMASKFYPKMFGDKVDVTSGGEKIQTPPVQVIMDGQEITLK